MTNARSARIRRIYGIVQSVSIGVAAICLMGACAGIYRQGDHAFSREAVAAAFGPIAMPVYLCLGLIAGGFLLDWILPADSVKSKTPREKTARPNSQSVPDARRVRIIRTALIVLGIACLAYGFLAGGTVDVLTKAVNICTECIGLG